MGRHRRRRALPGAGLSKQINNDVDFTNNPESKQADTLLEERLRGERPLTETIVIRSETATVDDPAYRALVEAATADLASQTAAVKEITNYYQASAAGDSAAAYLVSEDRHATTIHLTMVGDITDAESYGPDYVDAVNAHRTAGYEVYSVGDVTSDVIYAEIEKEDLAKSETIGLPVAIITLIIVFGALVAAGLPLLLGLISIVVAIGLTSIVARFITVSSEVTTMITMIGLAVGIDYALFVVERFREERRNGHDRHAAIEIAGATAGKAVLFSGLTVILALSGMFLIPISVFHSLGAGAILAVLVAVAATQTFIPAMLGLLGDKINWPRRRKAEAVVAPVSHSTAALGKGFWGRTTRVVMRHPVVTLIVALAILITCALPVLDLKTGNPGIESMPDSDLKTGYQLIARDFYAGDVAPVEIVIDGDVTDPGISNGIDNLVTTLGQDSLYGPATVVRNPAGDLTLVSVPMSIDSDSPAAWEAIDVLRDDTVPAAFGSAAESVYVGGASASTTDFNATLGVWTPIVFAFVLGLSFLLLLVAFRSIIVPLKAIVMNLLSVAAAYGVVVAVFQKGYLADTLGMTRSESVAAWLPVFMFCILFGLSMDYHVFLLSRIREHFDRTGDNDESVAIGLASTGKIITGAALIMVAVFGGFATGRMVSIQQFGLGLAVAVFLDATIVRSLLVPASMKLLGERNWYLPKRLRWLPDVRIEGNPSTAPAPALSPAGDD